MFAPISTETIGEVLKLAIKNDIFSAEDTCIVFYDLAELKNRLEKIKSIFPAKTLHAIAMKANPLLEIQKEIASFGFGSEVASFPEFKLAQKAQFPSSQIVFDSPVKTIAELSYALSQGAHINADSFGEIERIASIKKEMAKNSNSNIGIRINPQIATGKISYTVTAGSYSKFGIALKENQEKLLETYSQHPWLNGIHVHIGSQTCSPDVMIEGIRTVVDFALSINEKLKAKGLSHRIKIFDIGGGFPATYERNQKTFELSEFCKHLKERAPKLFDGTFQLVTEFGRHLHANLGWAVSKVEYVKEQCNACTALIHVGADLMLRECYNPNDWYHDLAVFDKTGHIKNEAMQKQIIAGPLCFSGDIISRDIVLPRIEPGDHIVICDIGAYTFSMWSRYNSRPMPKIVGYDHEKNTFQILKERESVEKVISFWS